MCELGPKNYYSFAGKHYWTLSLIYGCLPLETVDWTDLWSCASVRTFGGTWTVHGRRETHGSAACEFCDGKTMMFRMMHANDFVNCML